jgi:beta-galactosidase/beta-glucuronidase
MNLKDAVRTLLFKDKVQGENNQLITRWGRELDPGNVLTEYPRPQLRRDKYVTLNGYWDYAITKEGRKPERFDGRILVPFSPESILSGVNRQLKPDEFLWYQRQLPVEHRLPGKRLLLHFGAVDQSCEIYINDEKVAEHTGGYLPFSIDVTGDIEEGEIYLR